MTALPTSQPYVKVWCSTEATGESLQSANEPYYTAEQMNEFAGQYAIKVLERKIESLTAARDASNEDRVNWHQDGMVAGLQIAIDALKLEIPFVKLERGPLVLPKTE